MNTESGKISCGEGINLEDERKAFEDYWRPKGMNLSRGWYGEYSQVALIAWQAWVAAVESRLKRS